MLSAEAEQELSLSKLNEVAVDCLEELTAQSSANPKEGLDSKRSEEQQKLTNEASPSVFQLIDFTDPLLDPSITSNAFNEKGI